MGTRGALGFVIDGEEKITYNHFDSYPSGLGVTVLNWLRKQTDWDAVKDQVRQLLVVDAESKPTQEQIDHLVKYANLNVADQNLDDWYCLLRETQGMPGLILEAGVVADAKEFPLDSLFCEWAYIVDFDHEKLEVYRGFQHEPHTSGRFHDRGPLKQSYSGETYHPVKLVGAYSIRELPADATFEAQVDPQEEDDDV